MLQFVMPLTKSLTQQRPRLGEVREVVDDQSRTRAANHYVVRESRIRKRLKCGSHPVQAFLLSGQSLLQFVPSSAMRNITRIHAATPFPAAIVAVCPSVNSLTIPHPSQAGQS